jgi:hypothetical protein
MQLFILGTAVNKKKKDYFLKSTVFCVVLWRESSVSEHKALSELHGVTTQKTALLGHQCENLKSVSVIYGT